MSTSILVVEDDPANRQLMLDRLTALGYKVLTAGDALKGVEAAQEYKPDLILTDFLMPSPAGESIFSGLASRPETHDIPVIVMTGQPLKNVKGYIPLSLRTRLMSKPIDFDALQKTIAELVKKTDAKPEG